jgi:hypothetical protein
LPRYFKKKNTIKTDGQYAQLAELHRKHVYELRTAGNSQQIPIWKNETKYKLGINRISQEEKSTDK